MYSLRCVLYTVKLEHKNLTLKKQIKLNFIRGKKSNVIKIAQNCQILWLLFLKLSILIFYTNAISMKGIEIVILIESF